MEPCDGLMVSGTTRNVAVQEAINCVGDSERGMALVLQKQFVECGATTDSINSDSLDL